MRDSRCRWLLGLTGALATLALSWLGATRSAAADQRPNILVAFADDWGRYASAYGRLEPGGVSDIVRTPNFDRLASEGVLFTQAYVNAPSCTPCRSSFLSGQYFWRTGLGAILQGARWDESIPSYPLLLEKAGYRIGQTYKVWSPGTPVDAPYGGQRTAFEEAGRRFNRFSQFVEAAKDKEQARAELLNEVRQNFSQFLDQGDSQQPFCYWFGPTNCHRKWVQGSGRSHWGLDPDALRGKLPKFLPDVEIIREDFCDYLGEVQAFDAALGILLEELDRRGLADNTMVIVSGDHGIPGIPRGKCNLYDLGTRVPLAIRWPGVGRPGSVVDDFVCLPDLAPTILQAADLQPHDVMTGRSLVPVLESGRSGQVDPQRDFVVVGRERHVAKARSGQLPYPQRAIRTARYLYIRNFKPQRFPMGEAPGFGLPDGPMPPFEKLREDTGAAFADLDASPTKAWMLTHLDQPEVRSLVELTMGLRPAEELYDVQADPDSLHNLAEDPRYAQVKAELSARLLSLLRDTGDPRVQGDGGTYDLPPFAGPVEAR
ncbi:MAG: sulfatase [Planctomycetota bacterium]|nr:MAG: sulfatase [Planctomycetota bacterium]